MKASRIISASVAFTFVSYAAAFGAPSAGTVGANPTVGEVINMVNDLWRAFEFGYRSQWAAYGTDQTKLTITPNSWTGMTTLWDSFRTGLGSETHWMYSHAQHRVDIAGKTVTYSLSVVMKDAFSFPWVNLTQGTLTANGMGILTFDSNWKLASLWQDAFVDLMLGDASGHWPSGASPYISMTQIAALPALPANPDAAQVVNAVNDMWRSFEYAIRDSFISYGSDTTQVMITPNNWTGMAAMWDSFRVGLGGETHWQYHMHQHRVDLVGRTVTYSLKVIMKHQYSFPWVNLTGGTLVANGQGVLTYDAGWKLTSLWQDAYVDLMLGATAGRYPSGSSPYIAMSAIGSLPAISMSPTPGEVINAINDIWRSFEFAYRSNFIAYGTDTTQIMITPNNWTGMATMWDSFRVGLGGETHWQYMHLQHRIDLVGRTATYNLQVIMKDPFSFPWVNLTQGTLTANGIGVMTFDSNWKLSSLWQDAYVDLMLGATQGHWPSGSSPYQAMSSIGALPSLI